MFLSLFSRFHIRYLVINDFKIKSYTFLLLVGNSFTINLLIYKNLFYLPIFLYKIHRGDYFVKPAVKLQSYCYCSFSYLNFSLMCHFCVFSLSILFPLSATAFLQYLKCRNSTYCKSNRSLTNIYNVYFPLSNQHRNLSRTICNKDLPVDSQ